MERLIKIKQGYVNMSNVALAIYHANLQELLLHSPTGAVIATLSGEDADATAKQINRLFRLGQANILMLEDEHREENRLVEE